MKQATPDAGRYLEAGVDIDAGNTLVERIKPLARSTRRRGTEASLGGFGALFDLKAAGFVDPVLVSTTDGVGTKLLLAMACGRHDTIGIDLVAMCVNDLVVQGAEPLLFLDYFATGKLDVDQAAEVIAGIAKGCELAGCALSGGETAEMPGMYGRGHYDLAGFAVGAAERGAILPHADVRAGDVLLGLASSGVHSNGFSLVRLILEESRADLAGPAPFARETSLGEALLTPTRIYVRSCLAAIRAGGVKALAHITGGGLVENVPRVLPAGLRARIDTSAWRLPPVMGWLKRTGRLAAPELGRTFNAGIGMVLVCAPEAVEATARILAEHGETVHTIGRLEPGDGETRVVLDHLDASWS